MPMDRFSPLRGWVNAGCLTLILAVNACAVPPAPQVTAPPPGQGRIWFYRLWAPSESLNVANIDAMESMSVRSNPVVRSIAMLLPASTISRPRTSTSTTTRTPMWRSPRASRCLFQCST